MTVVRVSVQSVVVDSSIYPREKWKTETVERYADAMRSGAHFPPLILEEGTSRLLDGMHRLKAYQRVLEQPELLTNGLKPDGMVDVEFVAVPEGIPAKLYAASLSAKHGDRLTNAELRVLARETYEANPEFKQVTIKELFAVSVGTVNAWVSDITARRREERAIKAGRLQMLGWTQEQMGDALGVAQGSISADISKFSELKKLIPEFYASRGVLSDAVIGEACKRFSLSPTLAWAVALEGKSDIARAEALGIKLQPYDVWHFNGCHDLMGSEHPGRIPGELVVHTLHFFTEPGDRVVDPMAGSGTTLDACLLMGRLANGYDIDHHHERPDIQQHDFNTGWAASVEKAQLVFWDPPYFDKKDSGYVDGSISRLDRMAYLGLLDERFAELHQRVKAGTRLAFLMSDWNDESGNVEPIMVHHYVNLLEKAGWKMLRHIQTPLPTQQVHPAHVEPFREARRLARLNRYLLVAVKV